MDEFWEIIGQSFRIFIGGTEFREGEHHQFIMFALVSAYWSVAVICIDFSIYRYNKGKSMLGIAYKNWAVLITIISWIICSGLVALLASKLAIIKTSHQSSVTLAFAWSIIFKNIAKRAMSDARKVGTQTVEQPGAEEGEESL